MKTNLIKLLFIIIFFLSFIHTNSYAHPAKKHKPIKCIPEEELTRTQKDWQKSLNFMHRLTKNQQNCLMLELEAKQKEIENVEDLAKCPSIPFNHYALKDSNIFLEEDEKSKVIKKIKKNEKILFISEGKQNWNYITVKDGDNCVTGYIKSNFVVANQEIDRDVSTGSELISIFDPKWKSKNKLMSVPSAGAVSIIGAVKEGAVDEIIINEEEEIIQSDNSFSHLIFVENEGAEVRIIANKAGKKVKELIFKIKVGE